MKKTSNNYYLVLEYCNDGDLDTYVKKRKYLTEEEALKIADLFIKTYLFNADVDEIKLRQALARSTNELLASITIPLRRIKAD